MPVPLEPALNIARARGLRVIQGESSATARALARRAAQEAAIRDAAAGVENARGFSPYATFDVLGPTEGDVKTVTRRRPSPAVKYSPAATKAQAKRSEMMASHPGPAEDLSDLAARYDAADKATKGVPAPPESGMTPSHTPGPPAVLDLSKVPRGKVGDAAAKAGKFLDAFERKYGWRPSTPREATDMMSPAQLEELGFPDYEP